MKYSPKKLLLVFTILLFTFGIYSFYKTMFREFHPVISSQPKIEYFETISNEKIESKLITPTFDENYLSFNLSDLHKYKLVRFFDPQKKISIPIIAYFTSDGRIVTAFSLSENCKSQDFYLQGANIHCANCPSYWNKESLEAYACCSNYYPQPFNSKLDGDVVKIPYEVLTNWKPRQ